MEERVVRQNVHHLSKTANWGTPVDTVEMIRDVLGGIDVDPATSVEHNQRVRAMHWLDGSPGLDGLKDSWWPPNVDHFFTALVNPPGDKTGGQVKKFWQRLVDYWTEGACAAVWVGFNLNQLQVLQQFPVNPLSEGTVLAFPDKRLHFIGANDEDAPSHANYLVLLPPRDDKVEAEAMGARWRAWCEELHWSVR